MFVRFLYYKVFFLFSPLYSVFFRGKLLCAAHIQGIGSYTSLLEIHPYPSFVYLLNHLFITVWTHEVFIKTLGYNPILFYIFCCSNCSQFGDLMFFTCFLYSFDLPPSLWFLILFIFFFTSLFSGTKRCSTLILYTSCPVPTQQFLPRIHGYF